MLPKYAKEHRAATARDIKEKSRELDALYRKFHTPIQAIKRYPKAKTIKAETISVEHTSGEEEEDRDAFDCDAKCARILSTASEEPTPIPTMARNSPIYQAQLDKMKGTLSRGDHMNSLVTSFAASLTIEPETLEDNNIDALSGFSTPERERTTEETKRSLQECLDTCPVAPFTVTSTFRPLMCRDRAMSPERKLLVLPVSIM
jgi:hypothetical protein